MPKIATTDLTPDEFLRALKRNKFTQLHSILGTRFRDETTGQDYAGLYAGRGGLLSRRFTVKHLLAERAARDARPTKAPRKPRVAPAGAVPVKNPGHVRETENTPLL